MSRMVVVVGAGFSGMSAAVHLSQAGYKVTLLEKSPRPGGRSYSFRDSKTDTWIDNGQHLLMGCYYNTLELLDLLGTRNQLQELPLRLVYRSRGNQFHEMNATGFMYPFNLLKGLCRFNTLNWKDRFALILGMRKIGKLKQDQIQSLNKINCKDWLISLGQTPECFRSFWDPILIATLNETSERAAADGLATVVQKALLAGPAASRMLLPKGTLLDLYYPSIENFLNSKGGQFETKAKMVRFHQENNKISGIEVSSGNVFHADTFVFALPPTEIQKILHLDSKIPGSNLEKQLQWDHAPIVSIYLWLKRRIFEEPMIGLLDSPLHWVFDKTPNDVDKQLITVTISAAHDYLVETPQCIFQKTIKELELVFSDFQADDVLHWKVVNERKATVSMQPNCNSKRADSLTDWGNLFLAGDWTNTGLPATIESAVTSGKKAAQCIIDLN